MQQRLSGLCHSAECAQSVEFGRFSAPVCGFVGSAVSNDLIPTVGSLSMTSSDSVQTVGNHGRLDGLSGLCRIGGVAAFALILYCLLTIVEFSVVGVGVPPNGEGVFGILHDNWIKGLFDLITHCPRNASTTCCFWACSPHCDESTEPVPFSQSFWSLLTTLCSPRPQACRCFA